MAKTRGNSGSGAPASRKPPRPVQVRMGGQLLEHLRLASHILQLSKPELLRRAWSDYFAKLRRQYQIPKGKTLEEFMAEEEGERAGP